MVIGGAHASSVETGGITVETDPILVFGKLLKALRERVGMSQRQLADIVHYSARDPDPRQSSTSLVRNR
jgi:hypothetical protein